MGLFSYPRELRVERNLLGLSKTVFALTTILHLQVEQEEGGLVVQPVGLEGVSDHKFFYLLLLEKEKHLYWREGFIGNVFN